MNYKIDASLRKHFRFLQVVRACWAKGFEGIALEELDLKVIAQCDMYSQNYSYFTKNYQQENR
jgi:hypothetical protein